MGDEKTPLLNSTSGSVHYSKDFGREYVQEGRFTCNGSSQ